MATIGKVSAVFTASTSGLRSGVNQGSRSLKQMEGSVSSLRNQMRTLVAIQGAQLFGSIASSAASYVRSLGQVFVTQMNVIDGMSKLAARTGYTYAEMQSLALAADLAGVSTEKLAGAMQRADRNFVLAQNGSKSAAAAFGMAGLAVQDLAGKSDSERFKTIANAIEQIPGAAERSAAAIQIFGRSGAELMPLFAGGADAIEYAAQQAERLGLNLTTMQGKNVEAMKDSFTLAGRAVEGVTNQIVAYLAPAIESVTTAFTDLIGGIGGANIGQFIGEGILEGARFFAQVADAFVAQAGGVFQALQSVGQYWAGVWDIGQRVASALAGVGNLIKAGILAAILPFSAAVQGLARIAQEIGKFLGFDTKSIDQFLAGARAFNKEIVSGIKENVGQAGKNFGDVIGERTKTAGEDLAGPFTQTIDEALRRAREAAAARDTAVKQVVEVKQPPVTIDARPIKEAVKGIESRSSEGIREMFRIMRGPQPEDQIQNQQLEAQLEIARNTRNLDLDLDVVDLPAAAGA